MWYALYGEDAANSLELRRSVRSAHLLRLEELQAQGRLLIAGPLPAIDSPDPGPAGFAGSLIVAEFSTQTEAEQWLLNDPYVSAGVFCRHWVRPFIQVFPK